MLLHCERSGYIWAWGGCVEGVGGVFLATVVFITSLATFTRSGPRRRLGPILATIPLLAVYPSTATNNVNSINITADTSVGSRC